MNLKNILKETDLQIEDNKKHLEQIEKLKVYKPSELVERVVELMKPEKNPIKIFPSLDKDMEGKWKGQLVLFNGFAGSKKSMAALQVARINNIRKSIYSTMEMNDARLLFRYLDMIDDTEGINFGIDVDKWNNTNTSCYRWYAKNYPNDLNKLIDSLKKLLSKPEHDNILITQKRKMTTKDYEELLKINNPEILIVDGLSVMGGDYKNFMDKDIQNTEELKALSNDYNVLTIVMTHCSRPTGSKDNSEWFIRNTRNYIRNGEKLTDNMDSIVQFSQIEDESQRDFNNNPGVPLKNKGFVRFWNKRNSGNQIDLIYDFDTINLSLTENTEDPKSYLK